MGNEADPATGETTVRAQASGMLVAQGQITQLETGKTIDLTGKESILRLVELEEVAFGTFDIQIKDFETFFRQYAGSYKTFTIFELQHELRDFIAPKFGEVLAQENISVKDVAGNITELGKKITPFLKPYFAQFGIDLVTFTITSVTLPDEVSAHYDKITNMNMVTDMDKFTKFNTANAIGQQGTAVNEGIANGMMAGMMMNQIQQNLQTSQDDITVKLQKLKTLFENGLIDEAEYKQKKAELIDKF